MKKIDRTSVRMEKFNFEDAAQLEAFIKWDSDKELYHLVNPIRDPKKIGIYPSDEELLIKYKSPHYSKNVYVIWFENWPVGTLSMQIDPPQLMKKTPSTSWLGLMIGEREYWGTGVASVAMELFEKESMNLGLQRIELGTFAFNLRAEAFYKKLGYVEIGRIKDFTYYNDRFWDDIRMEKML